MPNQKKTEKDVTGMVFDTQTGFVLMSMPRGNHNKIKEKIASVREVVPSKSNNEITLVLEHFEYNVADTIAAFLEGGATRILQEWNFGSTNSNKMNRKNKNKVETKPDNYSNGVGSNAKSSAKSLPPNNVRKTAESSSPRTLDGRINNKRGESVDAKSNNSTTFGEKMVGLHDKSEPQLTHLSSTVSDSLSDASSSKNSMSDRSDFRQNSGKKGLEKPIKDLDRHSVSLQRVRNLLSEEFGKSEKRLRQSFQELHKILQEREAELTKELNEVKAQANNLLEGRIDQANKLKISCGRIGTMNGDEANALRIDLKHFISERKYDEDLGRTVRFMRDHDRLMKEIRTYGEVIPARNQYTGRRKTVSSIQSEPAPTAVIAAVAAEKPSTSPSGDVATGQASLPAASAPSSGMSAAELGELREKLQNSLRSQGLSVDAPSNRFNGATTSNRFNGPATSPSGRTNNRLNQRPNRNNKRPSNTANGKHRPNNKPQQSEANIA